MAGYPNSSIAKKPQDLPIELDFQIKGSITVLRFSPLPIETILDEIL